MTTYSLSSDQVKKFLPHRFPFLLVDRILEIHPVGEERDSDFPVAEVGTRVIGLKNVSANEPYFQGHFPDFAIVPGVLIVETMAQVAGFSVYPSLMRMGKLSHGFQCILIGLDKARFRKPAVPGDRMIIESEVVRCRGKIWSFQCSVSVEGQRISEAEILANLTYRSQES
jgi:3-hydroxyacyl-[acyl-carrier-protein] dehydratase